MLEWADVAGLASVDGADGHPGQPDAAAHADGDHLDLILETLLAKFEQGLHQAQADQGNRVP